MARDQFDTCFGWLSCQKCNCRRVKESIYMKCSQTNQFKGQVMLTEETRLRARVFLAAQNGQTSRPKDGLLDYYLFFQLTHSWLVTTWDGCERCWMLVSESYKDWCGGRKFPKAMTIRRAILTKYTDTLKLTSHCGLVQKACMHRLMSSASYPIHACIFEFHKGKMGTTSNNENYYIERQLQKVNAFNSYFQPEL